MGQPCLLLEDGMPGRRGRRVLPPRTLKSGNQREGIYRQMWETILRGEVWRGELYDRRKEGTIYLEQVTITPVTNEGGDVMHFVAIKQDISVRRQQEEELGTLSTLDPVTRLPNWKAFLDVLQEAVELAPEGARLPVRAR
ncbi:MAG: PAS domain S-box protein [Acidobacteria bacterium]|nr:PAS domain S-box protein [Acidobacteriota bacterium]MCK6681664.1 PAS domain S-box protein [Thermoanaerobaculia bacterium]